MKTLPRLLFDLIPLYHSRISSALGMGEDGAVLNRSQERALMITQAKTEVLPTQLGRCLDMKPGSLTSLLDALEAKGLAARHPDPADRRKQWVRLTDQGAGWVHDRRQTMEDRISAILEILSPQDKEDLEFHLREASRILEKL